VVFSFTGGEITTRLDGVSLRWYRALLDDDELKRALGLSLTLGALAATAAVIVGSVAAVSCWRGSAPTLAAGCSRA
jgi:putrescine transport system permease protein